MPRTTLDKQVVVVSGAPGSGKTSLAGPLAAELGFALLANDKIKESLHAAASHPVHVMNTLTLELLAEFDQPFGIGELIVVDTTVPSMSGR